MTADQIVYVMTHPLIVLVPLVIAAAVCFALGLWLLLR